MVGVQHAKRASEKTKEMVIDMVQMSHEGERRLDEGKKNFRAPFASPRQDVDRPTSTGGEVRLDYVVLGWVRSG
jgi:hypothetical protein